MTVYGQHSDGLFDADAEVPATVYESVLPDPNTAKQLDAPPLPWTGLYRPDGKFVPESELGGMSMSDEMMAPNDGMSHESMGHSGDSAMMMPSAKSDSRGVVKKIYSKDGKIKLKHGPIDKLEMPGMTMIFYVKDPAMLDELKEGDEVGFDVELDGNSFYIIRFER